MVLLLIRLVYRVLGLFFFHHDSRPSMDFLYRRVLLELGTLLKTILKLYLLIMLLTLLLMIMGGFLFLIINHAMMCGNLYMRK